MYSCCNDAPECTGFPHSGIVGCCGSYHLTDAYRRLARPSSPLTAWASTVYASSLNLTTHRRLVRRCGHKRDANTPRSAPLITEGRGGVSFQFSACSGLLKSKYHKGHPRAHFRLFFSDTFHLSPSRWRPLGDSNPCCRRERAES